MPLAFAAVFLFPTGLFTNIINMYRGKKKKKVVLGSFGEKVHR